MQTLKELISKIKFDKRENPADYDFFYLDRINHKKVKINFKDILRVEGEMFVIEKNNFETEIPLHRIRQVTKNGEIIWQR